MLLTLYLHSGKLSIYHARQCGVDDGIKAAVKPRPGTHSSPTQNFLGVGYMLHCILACHGRGQDNVRQCGDVSRSVCMSMHDSQAPMQDSNGTGSTQQCTCRAARWAYRCMHRIQASSGKSCMLAAHLKSEAVDGCSVREGHIKDHRGRVLSWMGQGQISYVLCFSPHKPVPHHLRIAVLVSLAHRASLHAVCSRQEADMECGSV